MNADHSLAAPYVLGSLDEEERAAYESHVAGCRRCRREIARLEDGLVAMAVAESTPPPEELRARVLDAVEEATGAADRRSREPRRRRFWRPQVWIPAVAATAAIAVAVVISLTATNDPFAEVAAADDAVIVGLAPTPAFSGEAPEVSRVAFSAERREGAVEFAGLPQPGSGLVYELWIVSQTDPLPAGLFRPDASGSAAVKLDGEVAPGALVALTIEPEGGSASPSGEILFVAEL